jgi:hypothetical protein
LELKMSDSIERLVRHPNVDTQPPCSNTDIDEVSARLHTALPAAIQRFWQSANGAKLAAHEAELLSSSQVMELLDVDVFGELLLQAGFLPLLYDQESNYVCAACRAPLAPRIVYVLHDDSPRVLYRNADSFFDGCLNLLASDTFSALYFHETRGDYGPTAPRNRDDHNAAQQLIESGGDWDIQIAIQLLDESCVDEWRALLNGDRIARQDALFRLKAIDSDGSRALLRRDSDDFGAFVTQVCDAASVAGISFNRNPENTCIRVNRKWVDLNAFYGRRHIDNALRRLIDWLLDIRDGHQPTDRPGHYFAD